MKIKLLSFILMTALILPLHCLGADIQGSGTVKADVLNVRLTPDMEGDICGKLLDGEKVDIITKTGQWYEILYEDKSCFVHSDYIMASRKKDVQDEPVADEVKSEEKIATSQSAEGRVKAAELVEFAKTFLGTPYVWGGETPEEGFDCSGLVYYVYSQFDVDLYRVACDQKKNGVAVDLLSLMPGDIVLFWNRTYYSEINHVGIYVGNNSFIHAPQTGDVVKITTLESGYYANNLVAARRIFE